MNVRVAALFGLILAGACALHAEEWTYWIEPCPVETARKVGCQAGDPELGRWALEAWARESQGGLVVRPAATEQSARLRIHWGSGEGSLYGEARPIMVGGVRGAEIYVQSDTAARGEAMLRDAIVYLTCLHESGHALGFPHTSGFEDIMYNFRYGGDLVEYFARYRRLLKKRGDIAAHAGISEYDRNLLRARYPAK